tara:strand:+ start:1701 stop:2207 length:507 start_codon:yes stop_codon:yes gene_type:complete
MKRKWHQLDEVNKDVFRTMQNMDERGTFSAQEFKGYSAAADSLGMLDTPEGSWQKAAEFLTDAMFQNLSELSPMDYSQARDVYTDQDRITGKYPPAALEDIKELFAITASRNAGGPQQTKEKEDYLMALAIQFHMDASKKAGGNPGFTVADLLSHRVEGKGYSPTFGK